MQANIALSTLPILVQNILANGARVSVLRTSDLPECVAFSIVAHGAHVGSLGITLTVTGRCAPNSVTSLAHLTHG